MGVDSLIQTMSQGTKSPKSRMKTQAEDGRLSDLLKVAYAVGGGTIWSRPLISMLLVFK